MTHQVAIKLDDTTSASELDSFFTQIWSQDKRVRVVLDATECKKISLGRILSMKGVLDLCYVQVWRLLGPRDRST